MHLTESISQNRQRGFTLVEVLMAVAVGTVVMGALMISFQSQHATHISQDHVVEMQQNARMAMTMLKYDIRSAGYDPDRLGARIIQAQPGLLRFTRDDGTGTLEHVRYQLYDYQPPGRKIRALGRAANTDPGKLRNNAVAENVTHLEFRYLNADGNQTNTLKDIRVIRVSLLVQSARSERTRSPSRPVHVTPAGQSFQAAEGFFSQYFTATILCRNLGFQP